MSTLREQFSADLKTAMKAGEKGKVAAIRLIQSALKDKDIEARGAGKGEISPDEILAMLQKMIKQRQESIAIYDANSRPELADGERRAFVGGAYVARRVERDDGGVDRIAVLSRPVVEVAARDEEDDLSTGERRVEARRVLIVGGDDLHATIAEVADPIGGAAHRGDTRGRDASLKEGLDDEAAEVAGGSGDDDGHVLLQWLGTTTAVALPTSNHPPVRLLPDGEQAL